MKRTATANWQGTGKEGKGNLTTPTGILNKTPYTYSSRFEEGAGTNPEELIAAAHAGCFSMKLSFLITGAGFTPEDITTTATITLENGAITGSHLQLHAAVPGLDKARFQELAEDAKNNCPVSRLLNTNITLQAELA
jgi:osmotically inducible protein OsmC